MCLMTSAAYVGGLYALPQSIRGLPRDDPTHIQARFATTGVVCLLSVALANWWSSGHGLLVLLGVRMAGLSTALVLPLLLTAVLFTGPIVSMLMLAQVLTQHDEVLRVGWQYEYRRRRTARPWTEAVRRVLAAKIVGEHTMVVLRNLVVCPFTEELAFRACMVPVLLCAGSRPATAIWGAPLFFGSAHVHHFVRRRREIGLEGAAVETLVQFIYTYLFGVFSAFLFVRTGHLVAPVLAHMFCNFMSVPDFSFMTKTGGYLSPLHASRGLILVAYLCGLAAFGLLLGPSTSPGLYGPWDWTSWSC